MRAHKRSGAAVIQSGGSKTHVIEPRLSKREVILVLDQFGGRMIESPHAFVGGNGGGKQRAANYSVGQDAHEKGLRFIEAHRRHESSDIRNALSDIMFRRCLRPTCELSSWPPLWPPASACSSPRSPRSRIILSGPNTTRPSR